MPKKKVFRWVVALTGTDASIRLPVGVLRFAGRLLCDGALEDLSAIDLLLNAATRDEAVDYDVLLLADTEGAIDSLRVSRGVPARIIWGRDTR